MHFLLPPPEFRFAGFTFPKWVFTLPRGAKAERIQRMRKPLTGPYYHTPKPNDNKGIGFYLDSDGMPGLRWQWCDEVDRRIQHTGWFCDEERSEKIHGIVMRLPHGRGFLAGWSMGKSMASALDTSYVWESQIDAAREADEMAKRAAEDQIDYEREQRENGAYQ